MLVGIKLAASVAARCSSICASSSALPVEAPLYAGIGLWFICGVAALVVISLLDAGAEVLRKRRLDARGFGAFLEAGAPLRHPRLQAAFRDPESTQSLNTPLRLVRLGEVEVDAEGRLVIADCSDCMGLAEPLEFVFQPHQKLTVEGVFAEGRARDGFVALRIGVAPGEAVSLRPAFRGTCGVAHAAAARRLPAASMVGDAQYLLLGAPASLEPLRAFDDDGSEREECEAAFEAIECVAPSWRNKDPMQLPLHKWVSLDPGEPSILVTGRSQISGLANLYLEADAAGNVLSILVFWCTLGDPEWDWEPPSLLQG